MDDVIQKYAIPEPSPVFSPMVDQTPWKPIEWARRWIWYPVHRRNRGHQTAHLRFESGDLQRPRKRRWSLQARHRGNNVMYFETPSSCAFGQNAHHGLDQTDLRSACLMRSPGDRPVAGIKHRGRRLSARIVCSTAGIIRRRVGRIHFCASCLDAMRLPTLLHQHAEADRMTWTIC